jgi:predicted ester cyclase
VNRSESVPRPAVFQQSLSLTRQISASVDSRWTTSNGAPPPRGAHNRERRIPMSAEANKAAGRRIVEEGLNKGDMAALDAVHAPGFVDHTVPPGMPADLSGFKMLVQAIRSAFPDIHYHIDAEIAEGDMLSHCLTVHGTMKGDFNGMPATGKNATWQEMHIGRFVNGKVEEHWGVIDRMGMLEALGYKVDVAVTA